jgi:hypothetical protein
MTIILLNFSHPLTPEHLEQLCALAGRPADLVINLPIQFEPNEPFEPQLRELMSRIPLSAEELQTQPLLLNPPSLNFITAMLLAELHGRMGYFPTIVRLRPVPGALPARFEVAEIINLQAVRDAARSRRTGGTGG